jgi:YidC/Oxa1 family membrane protein insertase
VNRNYLGFAASMALLVGGYFYLSNYYIKQNLAQQAVLQPTVTAATQPASTAVPAPVQASTPAQVLPVAGEPAAAAGSTPAVVSAPVPVVDVKPEDLALNAGFLKAKFTQTGGCLVSVELSKFRQSLKSDAPVELFPNHQLCKAFGIKIDGQDLRAQKVAVERISPLQIRMTQVSADLEIQRTFTFRQDSYDGELSIVIRNLSSSEKKTHVGFELGARSEWKHAGGMIATTPLENLALSYRDGEKVHRTLFPFETEPVAAVLAQAVDVPLEWAAVGSMYFLTAVLPEGKLTPSVLVARTGSLIQKDASSEPDQTVYEAWLDHSVKLAGGSSKELLYKFFMGPKTKAELDRFSSQKLNETVDYGFFSVIAWPLFYILRFIEGLVGNWGLAIIILTALVKVLLYPLAMKSYVSMKKMQKIQPEIKALQERYKNDKQKLNQETMALMSQKGANPLGGCLPILPQIPIFFGLFSVFQQTFELRQAPFALWIRDLSVMDPYFVLPIAIAGLYFAQQKITPPAPGMDPVQQKMMQYLPLVFALMMVTFPSGLALYMVTNTVLTIAQQLYMMRKYKDV